VHTEGVRIGVVIPAYNAAAWVGEAIASVLAQTHHDWSLVVVDDGSTDGTGDVVARVRDARVRLIRRANAGVSAARNTGVLALGGYTCHAHLFLDADDWLAADALSRLAAALDAAPHAVAASGPYVSAGSRRVRTPPSGEILERLLVRNLFANGGHVLLRTEAVQAAGGFVPGIAYGEDWEFWIRLALRGPFAAAQGPAPVLFVRQHASGAYRRMAIDPAAFEPCVDAIFGNHDLVARLGPQRLADIRQRTEAENTWVVGRERIRHGELRAGRAWLRRSFAAAPSVKRALLLLAAHTLPLGPFAPYAAAGRENFACSVPTSPCGRKMMNTTSSEP
jgi:glycosyltransferase involved in cell wall biosynthesis